MVSRRAAGLASSPPAIADAHFLAESAPFHPQHRPDGYLNLGTAENRLVWDLLEDRLSSAGPPREQDARYAPLYGTVALREAVAAHLTRVCGTPVDAEDLVVVSGATGALDVVTSALCDPGDLIVVPAPYYSALDVDLCGRSGARLVPAPTGSAEGFVLSPAAIDAALKESAVRAAREGTKVRAIALTSPSNPTGVVHPASALTDVADVARRHDVDIISDEVYAGSVFGPSGFASLIDPAVNARHRQRTHLVWGFAKDFGLPGFKVGVLQVTDPPLRSAARALAYFAPTSGPTQALLTHLLADPLWVDSFAAESRRRLAVSYDRCVAALDSAGLPHLAAEAGFSVWIDLRGRLREPTFESERALWKELLTSTRVNILPGGEFASPEPGWFRLCHTVEPDVVEEGIERLGRAARSGPGGAVGAGPVVKPVAEPVVKPVAVAPVAAGGRTPSGAFADWYRVAGVRSGVRRTFHEEQEQGREFFPRALVPYLDHAAVLELPESSRRELAIRHLYQFLLSTTHVETRVVNRGAEQIANGRTGLDLPIALRLDAFKVYCDEGYHALYSLDLADQVAAVTAVPIPAWDFGGFVGQLERAGREQLAAAPQLAGLLQVVVFETLVTAVLNEVPSDPTVMTAVRDLTRDHARDEGRHHRFFSGFFHELWARLDRPMREQTALALPALILGCLTWDVDPVRRSLTLAGLDDATARDVIADCYGPGAGAARVADVARATVRMCESAGVLDVPGARETFAAAGLLLPTTGRG
jgi:1-aminocyclopropane-1-carboxylate synthase